MVYTLDLPVLAALAAATATFVASVVFSPSESRGMVRTGDGIKTLRIGALDVRVYFVRHEMRRLPPVRSREAFIEADVDKRFLLRMLRDLDAHLWRDALRDALLQNGCEDAAKIRVFLSGVTDVRAGTYVTVSYDAAHKTTTLAIEGGSTVSVEGKDFMRFVWSIWLGKTEAPSLADALTGKSAA